MCVQCYDPSNITKTAGGNNQWFYSSKCLCFCNSSENTGANILVLVLSSPIYPVSLSMSYHLLLLPHRFILTSSRQTIAFNCEKCQLQKSKVNNCWKSLIQISPLTGLSLSSFCFSQGPTLKKAFSSSSSSLGIRWIAAFVFACYLNCGYYLLCLQGLSKTMIHRNISASLSLLVPLSPTVLQNFCESVTFKHPACMLNAWVIMALHHFGIHHKYLLFW